MAVGLQIDACTIISAAHDHPVPRRAHPQKILVPAGKPELNHMIAEQRGNPGVQAFRLLLGQQLAQVTLEPCL